MLYKQRPVKIHVYWIHGLQLTYYGLHVAAVTKFQMDLEQFALAPYRIY